MKQTLERTTIVNTVVNNSFSSSKLRIKASLKLSRVIPANQQQFEPIVHGARILNLAIL